VLGQVASLPTGWRVLDRVDAGPAGGARGEAGGVGRRAGPDQGEELRVDRRVAESVVARTPTLEAQHRASTLS
jgi:hypothetical protein